MIVLYIAALLAGPALAVRVMVAGVLRLPPAGAPAEAIPARRARLSPALGAAGATVFGLVGAAMTRLAVPGAGLRFVSALLAGAVAVGGAGLVLKLWALDPRAPLDPEDDPGHRLQGTPATVTRAPSPTGNGEVAFRYDGVRRVLPARAVDGRPLAAGIEVVIDHVTDGVAWVEGWARVEARM
ncbi:MAG: hypothetical protein HYX65_02265 [Gemmatimonadetes bacterium]|nr:hypothetical protein [Gemmatimonadota bacterium]